MAKRSYHRGWGVPFQAWLWAGMALAFLGALGSPAAGCECEEEGIKWEVFEGPDPSVVCVGETFTITATASDRDLPEDPPWPECPREVDPVTITGAGSQSRGTPGIYYITVTADDGGSPVNDQAISQTVTVIVVGVLTITPPEECVVCTGTDVTFTATSVPPDYEYKFIWTGGGTPEEGAGGSFTTHWDQPGTYTVTVKCCDSQKSASINVVEPTCTGSNATPHCVWREPVPVYDSLPGCTYGKTNMVPPVEPEIDWQTCFDCERWKVEVTSMLPAVGTTIDTKNKPDCQGDYSCEAAECVKAWRDAAAAHQDAPCDTYCIPIHSLSIHETAHRMQFCVIAEDEAGQAEELVAALYRDPVAPFCDLATAEASLDAQVAVIIFSDMYRNINTRVELDWARLEGEACDAEKLDEDAILADICEHLQEPCDACP